MLLSAMSDTYFRELLGVRGNASETEIRQAYHIRAKEQHPDIFPEDQRELQQLKMTVLNEAYAYLLSSPDGDRLSGLNGSMAHVKNGKRHNEAARARRAGGVPVDCENAVGGHRDPSYAFYKQGFIHYSRALRGIEAMHYAGRMAPGSLSYREFARGLALLRTAYTYFARVVADYPESIWCRDARVKQNRIERFSRLYRRICSNLRPGPPPDKRPSLQLRSQMPGSP